MGNIGKPILNLAGDFCLTFSSPTSFTLYVVDHIKYWDGTMEWSTDRVIWSVWDGVATLSSALQGSKHVLFVRGTNNTIVTGTNSGSSRTAWHTTGANISVSGNVLTLLDWQKVALKIAPTTVATKAFACLFAKNPDQAEEVRKSLVDASGLVIPVVGESSYAAMFQCCEGLIAPPPLPVTTLAESCYHFMFALCFALTSAPDLPATTLAKNCYSSMFQQCTGLITVSSLPATTLAESCYYWMFGDCTSLTSLPILPATTLPDRCYCCMFINDSSVKLSASKTGEYQAAYRIPSSGTGTIGTESLAYMFASTGGTFTGDPTINTTYYTSNTIVG